jgi:quercetin dioxygenase-like cupin family protein
MVVHLLEPRGRGPVWGTESADLNATLLVWPAGHVVATHVNSERDVLLLVIDGSATVSIEAHEHALAAGDVVLIAKGRERRIAAGPEGVRYLTAHYRRGPLQIAPLA